MVNGKRVIFILCMTACTSSEQLTVDGGHGSDGAPPGDGDVEISKSGTRIKVSYLTTADGAKIFNGTFDAQRNEPCVFAEAADGALRCLPIDSSTTVYAGNAYADAACTTQLAADQFAGCTATPKYAVRYIMNCARARYSILEIGSMHTGPVYFKNGARCELGSPSSARLWTFRSEIPPSSFAAATTQVE